MAVRSPKHKLTRGKDGWYKRVNGRPKYIASLKVCPTGEDADAFYAANFSHLWREPSPNAGPLGDASKLPLTSITDLFIAYKGPRKISPKTLREYEEACDILEAVLGGRTLAGDLTPEHFARLRQYLASRFPSPHRLKKFVILIRSVFKWAGRPPLRLPVPDYGDSFALPKPRDFRLYKSERTKLHGALMFRPAEIRLMLKHSSRALRAMILLAVNTGIGNTDIAALTHDCIDLAGGWLNYTREKTGAECRAKLWPETITALREHLANRWGHKSDTMLFLSKRGTALVKPSGDRDLISSQCGRLMDRIDERLKPRHRLRRSGRNFYSLRRTCRTLAAQTGKELAIDRMMGHAPPQDQMRFVYTVQVMDSELEAVSAFIRQRIFGAGAGALHEGFAPGRKRKTLRRDEKA